MKTLNTYGEVLIALGEGKTVTGNDDSDWRVFNSEFVKTTVFNSEFVKNGNSYHGGYSLSDIKLPCTIKKEPEYLYEYEWFEERYTDMSIIPVRPTGNFNVYRRIIKQKHVVPNAATKTGRKFIIENGIPVEVK